MDGRDECGGARAVSKAVEAAIANVKADRAKSPLGAIFCRILFQDEQPERIENGEFKREWRAQGACERGFARPKEARPADPVCLVRR